MVINDSQMKGDRGFMFEPISIVELRATKKVRVVRLLPVNERQLRKLTAFGILPGMEIEIVQTYPTYVLSVGYTQIALDYEIAKNIIVVK